MLDDLFERWKYSVTAYARLQYLYAVVFVGLLFFGGLISLLNRHVGNDLSHASLFVGLVFAANFLGHAIIGDLFGTSKSNNRRRSR